MSAIFILLLNYLLIYNRFRDKNTAFCRLSQMFLHFYNEYLGKNLLQHLPALQFGQSGDVQTIVGEDEF